MDKGAGADRQEYRPAILNRVSKSSLCILALVTLAIAASKHLLESNAGGVALLDYNNDGLLDLYFVNGAALDDSMPKGAMPDKRDPKYRNRLYRHAGNGKFQDVTERAGVRGSFYGMGAAAGRLR